MGSNWLVNDGWRIPVSLSKLETLAEQALRGPDGDLGLEEESSPPPSGGDDVLGGDLNL